MDRGHEPGWNLYFAGYFSVRRGGGRGACGAGCTNGKVRRNRVIKKLRVGEGEGPAWLDAQTWLVWPATRDGGSGDTKIGRDSGKASSQFGDEIFNEFRLADPRARPYRGCHRATASASKVGGKSKEGSPPPLGCN